MSVEDADRVDFISIERTTDTVVLTIADHLDWTDEAGHIETLQKKLNTYLRFIESGEIESAHADSIGRARRIQVMHKEPLSAEAQRFFLCVAETVRAAGIGFEAVHFVPAD